MRFARPIFARIMRAWSGDLARRGGRFVVAMTPELTTPEVELIGRRGVFAFFQNLGAPIVDLTPAFADYHRRTGLPLRFKNDHHWNEEGCKLAAVEVFRLVLDGLQRVSPGDAFIADALADYYGAFPHAPVSARMLTAGRAPSRELVREIRDKYLAEPNRSSPGAACCTSPVD